MVVSPALLDAMAGMANALTYQVLEEVTYTHRDRQGGDPVAVLDPFKVKFESYSALELQADTQIDRNDLRMRVRKSFLATIDEPSRYDTVVRADGEVWQVVSSVGKDGSPWFICQMRQTA